MSYTYKLSFLLIYTSYKIWGLPNQCSPPCKNE